eukprot:2301418-Pleurochrysis_carterae.AAC.1
MKDARSQLEDIHEFVTEEEGRDEGTMRAFQEFRSEIVVTQAQLPRKHFRKIYIALARHHFHLVERRDGYTVDVHKLITSEELVVYLAKAFLPELSVTHFQCDNNGFPIEM